jgi:hypothetical protein
VPTHAAPLCAQAVRLEAALVFERKRQLQEELTRVTKLHDNLQLLAAEDDDTTSQVVVPQSP